MDTFCHTRSADYGSPYDGCRAPTLLARLAQREIGSGADEQAQRSLRQARRMASEDDEGIIVLPTDGKRPAELAEIILQKTGWLNIGSQEQG